MTTIAVWIMIATYRPSGVGPRAPVVVDNIATLDDCLGLAKEVRTYWPSASDGRCMLVRKVQR